MLDDDGSLSVMTVNALYLLIMSLFAYGFCLRVSCCVLCLRWITLSSYCGLGSDCMLLLYEFFCSIYPTPRDLHNSVVWRQDGMIMSY